MNDRHRFGSLWHTTDVRTFHIQCAACGKPENAEGRSYVGLTDLTLSRPRAITCQRQSGAPAAATNELVRRERSAAGVTPWF